MNLVVGEYSGQRSTEGTLKGLEQHLVRLATDTYFAGQSAMLAEQ